MSVRSAESIKVVFTTRVFATGVGTNADYTPTGTLYLNGVADAATVTVANLATGIYTAQVTLPTLALSDWVEIRIAATVSSVTDSEVIWRDTKDVFAGTFPDVAAGGSGGLLISGSNAGTTTLGAITVTGATTLAAVSGTTLTLSGAVAFQSTFATTGTTTFNAFTVTNALTVSGTTTLTGAVTASNAGNNIVGIDVFKISGDSTAADNAESFFDGTGYAGTNNVIPLVTLVNSLTTYTGNTLQTGDSFARIGVAGVGLTNLGDTRIANLDGTVTSRASQTSLDTLDDYVDNEVSAIKTKTDFLPSATAGAAGGVFIAGTNAATTITTALTTTFTGNLTGSVGSIATGGIAASSFAAGAIDAAAIATDAIGANEVAASAVTKIQAGLSTLTAAQVNTEADTALVDAGVTPTVMGRLDVVVSTRLATVGYTAPDNATIGTNAAALLNLQSRLPAALVSGRMDAVVGAITAGVITDAAFTTPSETAGRPTSILAMIRRVFEWAANKRTRNRSTGDVVLRNAADSATLETQTQSTSGSSDTQTKGV